MAKVYQETDEMSRDDLVELLISKDKKILHLESLRDTLLNVYDRHKVSDTFRIEAEKRSDFVSQMENLLCKVKQEY